MAEDKKEVAVNPEKSLGAALKSAQELYPKMVESSTRATIALSKVQAITNDAEDAYAAKLLLSVKATYEKVNAWRTTITKEFDTLKEQFMIPEKKISLQLSHKDSDALRVKKLRDDYANKKLRTQQEETAKAKALQNTKEEWARLKMVFENKFFEGVQKQLIVLENNISAYYNKITLETFAEAEKKFSVNPKLSVDYFESLFIEDYDKSKIDLASFNKFLSQVKEQFTYELINGVYVDKALPILAKWKEKLPDRKIELENLAKLNDEQRHKEELRLAAEAQVEKEQREKKNQEAVDAQKLKAQQEANVTIQDAAFEAQIAQQNAGDLKNITKIKTATITAEPVNIVKVLSQVMFVCFQNPNFKGAVKMDKATGKALVDEDGRPVYQDWVEDLLGFYAKNCDAAIDGVEIKESVSTVNRKTK